MQTLHVLPVTVHLKSPGIWSLGVGNKQTYGGGPTPMEMRRIRFRVSQVHEGLENHSNERTSRVSRGVQCGHSKKVR